MPSPATSSRTLIVDSRSPSGADRARSRCEALERITANEYDSIVLHTEMPGCDEYDLISYLAATWPVFFQRLTIHTMTTGRSSYQWNHETASLEALPSPQVGRSALPDAQPPAPSVHRPHLEHLRHPRPARDGLPA